MAAGSRTPRATRRGPSSVTARPDEPESLGTEAAGVLVDERGLIGVDRQMRTNGPHIFAIGDVVGEPMLLHKAPHQGKFAAAAIAGHDIAETVHALEMGVDAEDVGLAIHPHPTLSEPVGFAAEAAEGTITDLYLPKRPSRAAAPVS